VAGASLCTTSRRRYRLQHDEHQRGQGRRNRRWVRVRQPEGTEHSDEMSPEGFLTNNAAAFSAAYRPARTSSSASRSSHLEHRLTRLTIDSREPRNDRKRTGHDPCVGIRATRSRSDARLDPHGSRLAPPCSKRDVTCSTPRIPVARRRSDRPAACAAAAKDPGATRVDAHRRGWHAP